MKNVTHRVYWAVEGQAKFEDFSSDQMTDALNWCQILRNKRLEGKDISFISMSSEIEECTSLPGVSAPSADYDWKKRRV